jgi:plastocyanin
MNTSTHTTLVGFQILGICLVFSLVSPRLSKAKTTPVTVSVKMSDQLTFEPDHVTIHSGDTVEWKNTSVLVHTVTDVIKSAGNRKDAAIPKGAAGFDSGDLAPGASYRHTFMQPGQYRYFCKPHEAAGMTGVITVEP